MAKKVVSKLSGVVLPVSTILLLFLSSYLQYHHTIGFRDSPEEPSFEWALLFALGALLSVLPRAFQAWACVAILTVHQSVAFIDSSYYRFFRDFPSLHLLPTWSQTAQVGDSIQQLWSPGDLILLLPLALFLPIWWLTRSHLPREERDLRLSFAWILTALGVAVFVWNSVHPVRHVQLQRRFQNKAVAKLFGPQFYHYYDLYEWLRVTLQLGDGRALDSELVEKVIEESRRSSLEETPQKGIYQGRDFLFLQLESLQYFALDAEYEGRAVMPFLHQAKSRVHCFRLFDQTHLGRSADGQFIFLNSLHPPAARPLAFAFPGNQYWGLPKLFEEAGYATYYFHPMDPSFWNAGMLSESYGFQNRLFRDRLPARDRKKDIRGWGLTDRALFEQVEEILAESTEPYFAYVVTLMCHHPYSAASNEPVNFPPSKPTSMVRRYLRCAAVRDRSIKKLLFSLAQSERGRKTVICLAGDHDANLTSSEMKKLGYPVYPESESILMMLGTVEEFLGLEESEKSSSFSQSGGQIDVAPSLGHVFSLNMEESVFVGWNLFATQNRGTYRCRVGTWMDQTGKIRLEKSEEASRETPRFQVSEMLLGSDKIKEFKRKF